MSKHESKEIGLSFKILIPIIVVIALGVGVYFIFFNNKTETTNNQATVTEKEMNAEDITNKLKEKISNISKVIAYTAETDTNELLGRPNQYTSKTSFADDRISQEFVNENDAKGGTIEVFASKDDLENRKAYIEKISSQASIFAQYIYSKDKALLRIEKELTPEQAKEYEDAFYEIIK